MQLLIALLALLFILCIALTISVYYFGRKLKLTRNVAEDFKDQVNIVINKYNTLRDENKSLSKSMTRVVKDHCVLNIKYHDLLDDEDYLVDAIEVRNLKIGVQDEIIDTYIKGNTRIAIDTNAHKNLLACIKTWWRS